MNEELNKNSYVVFKIRYCVLNTTKHKVVQLLCCKSNKKLIDIRFYC